MNALEKRTDRDALIHALETAGAVIRGTTVKCPFHDDSSPSGSIWRDDAGVWRFKCHGCDWGGDVYDVEAKAAGKSTEHYLRDLRQVDTPKAPAKRPERQPSVLAIQAAHSRDLAATYTYTNPETGAPDLIVLRIEPQDGRKRFSQWRPDGTGFVNEAPPKPWPLYNRSRVKQADRVVVVEGEKSVHALQDIGVVATTSPCGAGKAAHADWTPLAGKSVIVWPDNDDNGRKHMLDVRAILETLEPHCTVGVVKVSPEHPAKWDVADLIAEMRQDGADVAEMREVVYTFLDEAEPTGCASDLEQLLEDTISGKRRVVPLPWSNLNRMTRALLPGTITLICGDPGAKKSFFLTQSLIHFHEAGVKAAVFMLEHERGYHLNRILAQRTGAAYLFNPEWVAAHPEQTRAILAEHHDFIDQIGRTIYAADSALVSYKRLVEWAEERAQAGCRVIAIDPVTAADDDDKPWIADKQFVMDMKRIARTHECSVILVTHPRIGRKGAPSLDGLAGGAAYPRFSQTVLWIESHDEPRAVTVIQEREGLGGFVSRVAIDAEARVTVRVAKSTNGPGGGSNVAFDFQDLRFTELGIITQRTNTRVSN
jgi:5S rRNA maturation endonuclease (ribonuclease M5)